MTVAKNLLRFQCFSHRHPLPSSNRASGARMEWWLVALITSPTPPTLTVANSSLWRIQVLPTWMPTLAFISACVQSARSTTSMMHPSVERAMSIKKLHLQYTQPEPDSPRPASEDLHEGSHNSNDGSWDESNLWASNMERQKPTDSLPSIEWNTKVATKEIESFP
ncbi:hypothetical protein Cni_G26063 [Canna indica]|uniref:Uncharacterized protein n=1 Tax=Canna indica TaxID=4628 RepID=A0AAQ3KYY3_9LILI|nr:hypothetical protein Cni_G26063 [Canna indica]